MSQEDESTTQDEEKVQVSEISDADLGKLSGGVGISASDVIKPPVLPPKTNKFGGEDWAG